MASPFRVPVLLLTTLTFRMANFRTVVKKFDTNQDSSLSDTEIAAVKKLIALTKVSPI